MPKKKCTQEKRVIEMSGRNKTLTKNRIGEIQHNFNEIFSETEIPTKNNAIRSDMYISGKHQKVRVKIKRILGMSENQNREMKNIRLQIPKKKQIKIDSH